ncbi:hypothetical protein [Vreelandella venusta]|uniref:hypothetical protein n=1 Tax=Vreelandella venusta TaxID=44935 RepID=UPI00200FC7A6|nr:hypothetical protein [Halomonas venusta]UQI39303.1 hypothetical protein M3L73_13830 [Halomonas venusta]
MEVKTDPAGRLHDLLESARKQPESKKAREALGIVFDVEGQDTESLLRLLADLIMLSQQTKSRIKALNDISHDIYLEPFPKIEKLLSTLNLDASWKPYRELLNEPTLYGLKFCSDKLSRIDGIETIDKSEIEAIQARLASLVDEILNSEIDPDVKELLLRNLEGLRQSLIAYRVRGLEGIEREVEAGLGSVLVNKSKIEKSASKGKTGSFLKAYIALLEVTNKTISTAKNLKELGVVDLVTKLIGVDNG